MTETVQLIASRGSSARSSRGLGGPGAGVKSAAGSILPHGIRAAEQIALRGRKFSARRTLPQPKQVTNERRWRKDAAR